MNLAKHKLDEIALRKGTVDIDVNHESKVVQVLITGQFDDEVMEEFFYKYIKYTEKLHRDDYNLIIDCRYLGVFQVHLLESVRQAYAKYIEFNTITFLNPYKLVGRMQIQRLAKEEGYENIFKFCDF